MKQGGPLRRRRPLQAKKGLAPGKPLEGTGVLKRSGPLPRRRTRTVPAGPPLPVQYDGQVSGGAAARWYRYVVLRAQGRCECGLPGCARTPTPDNPLQAHHVLQRKHIKAYVRGLRLAPKAASTTLAALTWDTRNGMALLERCHTLHTRQLRKVPQAQLRPEHWVFAAELGLARVLHRQYSG